MFPSNVVHEKVGQWLITASHHELHHQRYRCNYGCISAIGTGCRTDSGWGSSRQLVVLGLAAVMGWFRDHKGNCCSA
jgi:hypothetical protein